MHDVKGSRRERIGLILLAPAALVLAISYVGCGSSRPRSEAGLKAAPASITVTLINNCAAPDNVINVQMNTNTPWMSGGLPKCGAGQLCSVLPGTYPLDLGSQGLNFFSGSNPGTATKAEINYSNQLTFDISLITQGGNCPNSCLDASCCPQGFNEALKIYTNPVSRCVTCSGVACADGMHFPTDTTKQTNATAATALTIEFCPTAACPPTGWTTCNATQMLACRNLQDQPCTGELTVCCPESSPTTTHNCFCESGTWCARAPNVYNPCGNNPANYCYVPNQ